MISYYDNKKHANLFDLVFENFELTFDDINIRQKLSKVGFDNTVSTDYENRGIYLVSIRGHADQWSGKFLNKFDSLHILYHIPLDVIKAARDRKIIIVLDNQAEGHSLFYKGVDGYKEMHQAMKNLGLPKYSVCLITSNKWIPHEYNRWCIDNNKTPLFAHVYFLTGFFYFLNIPDKLCINQAIKNKESFSYNSLNRTIRHHRTEHLYFLVKNNLHKRGLVSGHYTNENSEINPSIYLKVNKDEYENTLKNNLPLYADGDWIEENPDISEQHIFNHDIYKNSLLTVVTETAFHQVGMFITEKTFKPIVAGHPFMILGQYKILETLKEMGYAVDFAGIDQSYDKIIDPVERFKAFHSSLLAWINTDENKQIEFSKMNNRYVEYNKKHFLKQDYEHDSYKRLYETIENIFMNRYQI